MLLGMVELLDEGKQEETLEVGDRVVRLDGRWDIPPVGTKGEVISSGVCGGRPIITVRCDLSGERYETYTVGWKRTRSGEEHDRLYRELLAADSAVKSTASAGHRPHEQDLERLDAAYFAFYGKSMPSRSAL